MAVGTVPAAGYRFVHREFVVVIDPPVANVRFLRSRIRLTPAADAVVRWISLPAWYDVAVPVPAPCRLIAADLYP